MDKLDLRKELKYLYQPSAKRVELVDVPELQFVLTDGVLAPGQAPATSAEFTEAIGALYGASYTLKFMSKLRADDPIDYPVMALEGLWATSGGDFPPRPDDHLSWTMMIMQPDHVTQQMFEEAIAKVRVKRDSASLARLRLERFREGLCVQIMHVGPYEDEPRTIDLLRTFAGQNGHEFRGRHHEIYLGDPRRAKPERLRTVLRYPVEKTG